MIIWKGKELIMMFWFIIFSIVFIFLALGALIDWKRKKHNNYPHRGTNLNNKPGESENYRMGNNENHTGGF